MWMSARRTLQALGPVRAPAFPASRRRQRGRCRRRPCRCGSSCAPALVVMSHEGQNPPSASSPAAQTGDSVDVGISVAFLGSCTLMYQGFWSSPLHRVGCGSGRVWRKRSMFWQPGRQETRLSGSSLVRLRRGSLRSGTGSRSPGRLEPEVCSCRTRKMPPGSCCCRLPKPQLIHMVATTL